MRIHLLAMSLLLAVPALADSTPGTAASTQGAIAAAADDGHLNETVCKKQPAPTGSRIAGKTVCMTNREWLALWDESKRAASSMQNKPISKGPSGN
jgi:hypothetical protein